MAWPSTPVGVGDLVTAAQLNSLPVRLANSTLGADTATFDFTSIPTIYTTLQLVGYLRGTAATTNSGVNVRFNNDSTGIYDNAYLYGQGTTTAVGSFVNQTTVQCGQMPCATAPANVFSPLLFWIPNYSISNNHRSGWSKFFLRWGANLADTERDAVIWRNNAAAISRITLTPAAGGNFKSGSRVTLYGWP